MIITEEIIHFIENLRTHHHITNENYESISKSIQFVLQSHISIEYKNNEKNRHPHIGLYQSIDENIIEVGKFEIEQFWLHGSKSMTIFVEDEYQNHKLSRLMIVSMLYILKYTYQHTNNSIVLSIDTDASDGFWDKIGMKENPWYNSNDKNIPYVGYEKIITVGELSRWGVGYDIFSYNGGKKKRTNKKRTNKKKTNKKKKRKSTKKTKSKKHKKIQVHFLSGYPLISCRK
jgi:hypothetical protein